MPTRVDLDLYQLGIRLTQCRFLHRECTLGRAGAEDVGYLRNLSRSLQDIFGALSVSAKLSQPQVWAGKTLCANVSRLWEQWSKIPICQLEGYDGKPEYWEFEEGLDRLEVLVRDATAQRPQAANWLQLGKSICDGAWLDRPVSRPIAKSRKAPDHRSQTEPEWVWWNEEEVKNLCQNLGLSMVEVFPKPTTDSLSSGGLPYGRSKYRAWQWVENGLEHLRAAATSALDTEQPANHSSTDLDTALQDDEGWRQVYLGLELNDDKRQVRRRLNETQPYRVADLSNSRLRWGILAALVASRDTPLSESRLIDVWERLGTARRPASGTISDGISELRRVLKPLGVDITTSRKVGRKLILISSSHG